MEAFRQEIEAQKKEKVRVVATFFTTLHLLIFSKKTAESFVNIGAGERT